MLKFVCNDIDNSIRLVMESEPEPEPLNGELNQETIVGELLDEIIEEQTSHDKDTASRELEQLSLPEQLSLSEQLGLLGQDSVPEQNSVPGQLKLPEQQSQAPILNQFEQTVDATENTVALDFNQPEATTNENIEDSSKSPELIVEKILDKELDPTQPEATTNVNDEDSNESREWVVEKILDKKLDSQGFAKYLVKWEGYPASDNSWEPLEFLADCDKIMQQYEIERAKKFATKVRDPNGLIRPEPTEKKRRMLSNSHKLFEVCDIMGLTKARDHKYFLLSFKNSTRKAFIRTTLANKMIPGKVIDFYVKNIRWRGPPFS